MTKEQILRDFLERYGSISSMGVINVVGTTSPGKVVSNLRRLLALEDKTLDGTWHTNPNTKARYMTYEIGER